MADSVDNDCSIAFEAAHGRRGNSNPQTSAQVRALTVLQDKWKLAYRALKTHLARATRGNPAAKRLFEKQDWKNARDFYAAIVDRFQLRKNSYRVATSANLFNFEAGTDSLQNLLDRLDGHITALENLGEVVSDAMKITISR